MFEKYNILDERPLSRQVIDSVVIEIVDSDFKEIIVANKDQSGLNIYTPIAELYASKNLNVPANLAKVFKYVCDKFKTPSLWQKKWFENLCEINKDFRKHKEEIEKYLILL